LDSLTGFLTTALTSRPLYSDLGFSYPLSPSTTKLRAFCPFRLPSGGFLQSNESDANFARAYSSISKKDLAYCAPPEDRNSGRVESKW